MRKASEAKQWKRQVRRLRKRFRGRQVVWKGRDSAVGFVADSRGFVVVSRARESRGAGCVCDVVSRGNGQ